jgi:hypothetical protein
MMMIMDDDDDDDGGDDYDDHDYGHGSADDGVCIPLNVA